MSKFRIFIDNKQVCFIWAVDEFDARYKIAKEAGIDIARVAAVDLGEEWNGRN